MDKDFAELLFCSVAMKTVWRDSDKQELTLCIDGLGDKAKETLINGLEKRGFVVESAHYHEQVREVILETEGEGKDEKVKRMSASRVPDKSNPLPGLKITRGPTLVNDNITEHFDALFAEALKIVAPNGAEISESEAKILNGVSAAYTKGHDDNKMSPMEAKSLRSVLLCFTKHDIDVKEADIGNVVNSLAFWPRVESELEKLVKK